MHYHSNPIYIYISYLSSQLSTSESLETAESDKAAELSGSETVLQESPEGELLPRIQQINEQIKQKNETAARFSQK